MKDKDRAKFEIGEIIHHRRYDYRGVVVAMDSFCAAPDEWYLSNRSQPAREQPWYHVLVHGGQETYVAEENLEADGVDEKVEHPCIEGVFSVFLGGRYHRFSPN